MRADTSMGVDCLRSFSTSLGCNSGDGSSSRGTDDRRLLVNNPWGRGAWGSGDSLSCGGVAGEQRTFDHNPEPRGFLASAGGCGEQRTFDHSRLAQGG